VALPGAAFYTTYIESPQGDNATALAEFTLSECSCFMIRTLIIILSAIVQN